MKYKTFVLCMIIFLISAAFLFTVYFYQQALAADFVDDWLKQKTSTNAGYFEGQKRGYFTGGSFSGRWRQSSESLATIQKPYIKSGCGGIDMFMGGFSFLNFEYLVQKFQRILQNAPAFAFGIALKVLTAEIADEMHKLEGVVDALNGLQLDDCKASKALVAVMADNVMPNSKYSGDWQAAQSRFLNDSGADTLWKSVTAKMQSSGGDPASVKDDFATMLSGCPADMKSILSTGSFFDAIGQKTGLVPEYIALIRGLVGDVQIDSDQTGVPISTLIPKCANNQNLSLDDVINGDVDIRASVSSPCVKISNVGNILRNSISMTMTSIAGKIKSRSPLTQDEIDFIDRNPLSVANALKMAVGTDQEANIIGMLADVTAKAYAFQIISDISARTGHALSVYENIKTAKKGGGANDCFPELFDDVITNINTLRPMLASLQGAIHRDYIKSLNETNNLNTIVAGIENFNKIAHRAFTEKFGGAVTMRAFGK